MGSTESTGGGGGGLWLLGLRGTFWQVAGCLVKVSGGLNWAVECCGGSWQAGWILDRSGGKCLLWMVGTVVGGRIEGREVWNGGVLVSCWEEFGLSSWSVVWRILGKVEMGFVEENGGVWARFGLM